VKNFGLQTGTRSREKKGSCSGVKIFVTDTRSPTSVHRIAEISTETKLFAAQRKKEGKKKEN
jgi:hypothetical protein